MFKFPCFRDKKWMKENGTNMKHPDEFLNVHFRPEFLKNYEHTINFEQKAEQVIRQIKSALFRQAIYKVKKINNRKIRKISKIRKINEINDVNKMNKLNKINDVNKMNKLNKMN
ncbi:hypothetical protein, conserved [Plasmodium malariae]|uniref:Uncharacterized protein n=1 Tax=Plasmodium malariae TaxID=5858 RepID=A0A1A8W1E1_PLAMA|nr:hypothetical protein, conserved [Plasmodium malariae]